MIPFLLKALGIYLLFLFLRNLFASFSLLGPGRERPSAQPRENAKRQKDSGTFEAEYRVVDTDKE